MCKQRDGEESVEYSMSVPSPEAAKRYIQLLTELWCNTPNETLDGKTPWEVSREEGGPRALRERLPAVDPSQADLVAARERELRATPRPDQHQAATYGRSGGLLNLFTDRPTEEDDDDWRRIEARSRGEVDDEDEVGSAEAQRRAAKDWNQLPSVLFAGLTPLQVLAGGGPREALLQRYLANFLEETVDPKAEFPSPAAVTRSSLLLLRRWQVTPIRDLGDRSPQELILEERTEILERKLAFLEPS